MTGQPARRTRRRRGSEGFSIIEFVVASALTLGVLTGAGLGITAARQSVAVARARDEAAAKAYAILEAASALGCQRLTDPSDARAAALNQRCAQTIGLSSSSGVSAAGDFTAQVARSTGFMQVTMSSRFLDAGATSCRPGVTSVTELAGGPPELLERSVTVSWTAGRREFSETFSLRETVSASTMPESGSVLVNVPAGTAVTLRHPSGSGTITRVASPCASSPLGGLAWFPSLKPGTYLVTTDAATLTLSAQVRGDVAELTL